MLLGIDTATRTAGLALYDENGVRAETTWWARENHTVSLMPELRHLLELAGVRLEEVTRLAVAIGPGSFTGLRIGLALAKGLALARGVPLTGIPTLDATAHAFARLPYPVWALLQAGRGRYAAALYEHEEECMVRSGDYHVQDVDALCGTIAQDSEPREGPVLVCGELDAPLRVKLHSELGTRIILADPAGSIRRAAFLAEVAWKCALSQIDDLDSLAPYYIPTASLPQTV